MKFASPYFDIFPFAFASEAGRLDHGWERVGNPAECLILFNRAKPSSCSAVTSLNLKFTFCLRILHFWSCFPDVPNWPLHIVIDSIFTYMEVIHAPAIELEDPTGWSRRRPSRLLFPSRLLCQRLQSCIAQAVVWLGRQRRRQRFPFHHRVPVGTTRHPSVTPGGPPLGRTPVLQVSWIKHGRPVEHVKWYIYIYM